MKRISYLILLLIIISCRGNFIVTVEQDDEIVEFIFMNNKGTRSINLKPIAIIVKNSKGHTVWELLRDKGYSDKIRSFDSILYGQIPQYYSEIISKHELIRGETYKVHVAYPSNSMSANFVYR
jgi:hypothetical protein